jgi:hypothetical protein
MAYPKQAKQEDPNADARTTAPAAPTTQRVIPPQTPGVRGGAPRLTQKVYPQRQNWQGAAAGRGAAGSLPTPSPLTLPQTQEQIGSFVAEVKNRLDKVMAGKPEVMARNPRFWAMYQQMPEPVATMLARRAHADQILGAGPVADYMRWLEGMNG